MKTHMDNAGKKKYSTQKKKYSTQNFYLHCEGHMAS